MDMLTRMARGAQMKARAHHKKRFGYEGNAWDEMSKDERRRMVECMRGAVEEMREPDEAMCQALFEAVVGELGPSECGSISDAVRAAWRKGIDAILQEKP